MKLPILEQKLRAMTFPDQVRLTKQETITDVPKFVDNHIKILKRNSGRRTFLPYYNRLLALYKILSHD